MNEIDLFLEAVKSNGLLGLAFGLVVLVGVFFAKRGGLVVTGNQARLANIVLAVILSGLDPTNPDIEKSITAAIASLVSALAFTLFDWLKNRNNPPALNSQAVPLEAKGTQPK